MREKITEKTAASGSTNPYENDAKKSGDDGSQNLIFLLLVWSLEYLPDLQSQRVCLSCGHLEDAVSMPASGETNPWAQVTGNLENLALLVKVDGVDGKAHEAHVDAVARRDEQGGGGRQGASQHEAAEALPEVCGEMDGESGIRAFYLECFGLHDCFFLVVLDHGPHPPLTRSPFPVRGEGF